MDLGHFQAMLHIPLQQRWNNHHHHTYFQSNMFFSGLWSPFLLHRLSCGHQCRWIRRCFKDRGHLSKFGLQIIRDVKIDFQSTNHQTASRPWRPVRMESSLMVLCRSQGRCLSVINAFSSGSCFLRRSHSHSNIYLTSYPWSLISSIFSWVVLDNSSKLFPLMGLIYLSLVIHHRWPCHKHPCNSYTVLVSLQNQYTGRRRRLITFSLSLPWWRICCPVFLASHSN